MPRRVFSVMTITVATFFALMLIVIVFSSLTDGDIEDAGSILQFDKALLVKLVIQWFNILLLTFVLIRVLYNPVMKFMAERTERIKNDIESARLGSREAQERKADYDKLIADIEKEKEEILNKAHRDAVEEHDRLVFDAQEQAKHLLAMADDEIRIHRENESDEIRRQIIEISSMIAARFIEASIDGETHDRYIAEALEDWSDRKWQA